MKPVHARHAQMIAGSFEEQPALDSFFADMEFDNLEVLLGSVDDHETEQFSQLLRAPADGGNLAFGNTPARASVSHEEAVGRQQLGSHPQPALSHAETSHHSDEISTASTQLSAGSKAKGRGGSRKPAARSRKNGTRKPKGGKQATATTPQALPDQTGDPMHAQGPASAKGQEHETPKEAGLAGAGSNDPQRTPAVTSARSLAQAQNVQQHLLQKGLASFSDYLMPDSTGTGQPQGQAATRNRENMMGSDEEQMLKQFLEASSGGQLPQFDLSARQQPEVAKNTHWEDFSTGRGGKDTMLASPPVEKGLQSAKAQDIIDGLGVKQQKGQRGGNALRRLKSDGSLQVKQQKGGQRKTGEGTGRGKKTEEAQLDDLKKSKTFNSISEMAILGSIFDKSEGALGSEQSSIGQATAKQSREDQLAAMMTGKSKPETPVAEKRGGRRQKQQQASAADGSQDPLKLGRASAPTKQVHTDPTAMLSAGKGGSQLQPRTPRSQNPQSYSSQVKQQLERHRQALGQQVQKEQAGQQPQQTGQHPGQPVQPGPAAQPVQLGQVGPAGQAGQQWQGFVQLPPGKQQQTAQPQGNSRQKQQAGSATTKRQKFQNSAASAQQVASSLGNKLPEEKATSVDHGDQLRLLLDGMVSGDGADTQKRGSPEGESMQPADLFHKSSRGRARSGQKDQPSANAESLMNAMNLQMQSIKSVQEVPQRAANVDQLAGKSETKPAEKLGKPATEPKGRRKPQDKPAPKGRGGQLKQRPSGGTAKGGTAKGFGSGPLQRKASISKQENSDADGILQQLLSGVGPVPEQRPSVGDPAAMVETTGAQNQRSSPESAPPQNRDSSNDILGMMKRKNSQPKPKARGKEQVANFDLFSQLGAPYDGGAEKATVNSTENTIASGSAMEATTDHASSLKKVPSQREQSGAAAGSKGKKETSNASSTAEPDAMVETRIRTKQLTEKIPWISQRTIHNLTGVSQSVVSNWIRGNGPSKSEKVKVICNTMNRVLPILMEKAENHKTLESFEQEEGVTLAKLALEPGSEKQEVPKETASSGKGSGSIPSMTGAPNTDFMQMSREFERVDEFSESLLAETLTQEPTSNSGAVVSDDKAGGARPDAGSQGIDMSLFFGDPRGHGLDESKVFGFSFDEVLGMHQE